MSELFIKQELFNALASLDALIFDVDGVILDVSGSFRAAISSTVQHFAVNQLGLTGDATFLTEEEVELFKFAGGFNDDADIATAAAALLVAKKAETGSASLAALRDQAPSWVEYTSAIKRAGGGPTNAEANILERLTPTQRRDFAHEANPKLVTRLFQEFYGGDDACRDLYGFDPEYIHGDGFYQREKVLLEPDLLPKKLKLALLTGRSLEETRLAMRYAKLTQRIPESQWVTSDDRLKKPDGRTLLLLREKFEYKNALYIGDTMDDLKTVSNYRELKGAGKARVASGIALTGPGGANHRRAFLEAGAEVVTPDVNLFLQYLQRATK